MPERVDSSLKALYRAGGITILAATLLAPAEVVVGLLSGTQAAIARTATVTDWFALFQNHWFLGLRSLGLLNMIGALLLAPAILAIYFALRREAEAYASLGAILFFAGITLYLADNRALQMLSLSAQYASAATEEQRSLLAAAGQAMLVVGRSRAGLALVEFGCLIVSAAMLRGNVFSRATAWVGMLGNALMMAVEVLLAVQGTLSAAGMAVAAAGGLCLVAWYALTGRRLLQSGLGTRTAVLSARVAQGGA